MTRPVPPAAPDEVEVLLRAHFASASLDADVKARHRLAIAEAALRAAAPSPLGRLRGAWRRGTAFAAAASLTLFGLGAGSVAAAAGAVPGDALYSVKRAVEEVRLALPADRSEEVGLRLALAERRLQEIEILAGAAPEALSPLLDSHDRLLADATALASTDPGLEAAVVDATATARDRLATLLTHRLPGVADDQARSALESALERLAPRSKSEAELDGPPAQAPPARSPDPRGRDDGKQDPEANDAAPPAGPPGDRPRGQDRSADTPGQTRRQDAGGQPSGSEREAKGERGASAEARSSQASPPQRPARPAPGPPEGRRD